MESDHDITVREIARELTRLARVIEANTVEMKQEFAALRKETVRNDVYQANQKTDHVEMVEIQRRLDSIEVRSKSLTTAFTGMLLSVMGGVIIFLITRGLSFAN